ncbi:MAG TPA: hypothetical protein VIR29_01085, partial [Anseongella sp.]
MPERITLNALLLCCLCTLPAILSGQTPTGNVNGFDTVRFIRPQAWYFAWESLEKALAGDPAGSSRHLFKDGNAWKFAMEDP